MGVFVLLLTILAAIASAVLFGFAVFAKRCRLKNFVAIGAVAWCVLYITALLGFSFASKTEKLAIDQPKAFCGFYLDCHLHTVVTGIRKSKSIGNLSADGEFRIVTLKVFSDARNPTIAMRLLDPHAQVTDASGRNYERRTDAEQLLPSGGVPLSRDVTTNEPLVKEIVFDLPENAAVPRLDVSEGYRIAKFIETILIGDEDSLWHGRELFAIDGAARTAEATEK